MSRLREYRVMLAEKVERGAWEAALVLFGIAALVTVFSLALMFFQWLGWVRFSLFAWYALGSAVGTALGLAALLFLVSLAAKGLRRLLGSRAGER